MPTAKDFNRILHREIRVHAAWLPITNTIQLGDYGVISGGVFTKMGNIEEFGVGFEVQDGEPAKLDFSSEGTRVVKMVGEAEVDALPDAEIEAKIKIDFNRANSFLLKADPLNVAEIKSVAQAARSLATAPGWSRRYRVVSSVYTGTDAVILSTKEANSTVEIGGTASALAKFDLGKVEAGVELGSTKQLGLEVVGKSGVVGLRMFKVKRGGRPGFMASDLAGMPDDALYAIDTDEELDDDL